MLENLNAWIQSLVIAIAITTIIEMILPSGSNKKYVKIVCSIYILYTILTPLPSLSKFDFSKIENNDFSIESSNIDTGKVSSIYIKAYEEEIKEKLNKDGFNIKEIKLYLNSNEDNISRIEINTYNISEEEKSKIKDKIKLEYEIENIIIR